MDKDRIMAARNHITAFAINTLAFAVFLLLAIAVDPRIGVAAGWLVLTCWWLNRQPEPPHYERPTLRMVLTVTVTMILAAVGALLFFLSVWQKP